MKLKKVLTSFIVSTALFTSLSSQAAVGFLHANPSIIFNGFVLSIVGGIGLNSFDSPPKERTPSERFWQSIYLYWFTLGLVLLDENNATLSLGEMSQSKALELGVGKDGMDAYNRDLPLLNSLLTAYADIMNRDGQAAADAYMNGAKTQIDPDTLETLNRALNGQ